MGGPEMFHPDVTSVLLLSRSASAYFSPVSHSPRRSQEVKRPMTRLAVGAAVLAITAAGCGSGKNSDSKIGTATSASAAGGMDKLVAAAKKEGSLHVITLPRDWANYGAIMDAFTAKYGIKIESKNPDGSSQDELTAITSRKGQSKAPDVVDV